MAFFKFRKAGDESSAAPRPPESIEAMRKRARHRLIGAGVLVLIGVVGFPLLFDTQPRPIAVDIPIEIPDRNKAKPLTAPARSASQPTAVSGRVTTSPSAATPSAPAASGKVSAAPASAPAAPVAKVEAPAPVVEVETRSEPKPEPKPEPRPESKATAKAEAKPAESAKAKALLEGKQVTSAAVAEGRFVVQVGAFADAGKAREARAKVEKAGLKTYTHEANTKDGKRIRVRVGPFASRGEADKAASKIKGLDLPAAILTL